MTKDEALEIMQILYAAYPNFNKNNIKGFNQIWVGRLMEYGNYKKTLKKANDYTMESPYPPAMADIIVKDVIYKDDGMATQIKQAEEVVKREKSDPVKLKERERLLEEMRKKWGVVND